MKKLLSILFLFILFLTPSFIEVHAETGKFFTISCNPAENSNNSMNFVWHTEKEVTESYVMVTKKSDTSWSNAVTIKGTSSLNSAFAGENAKYGTSSDSLKYPYEFTKNEATINDLEPGTEYMYKITDGTLYSDVRYFKTGDKEFNFVWISDFHAYYADARRLKKATQAVDKCIEASNNNVDFIFSTGDIVAHGGTYEWWKQVSEASWMKKYMFTTTLGNHDWMTSAGTYYSNGASFAFMDACYNNPRNGFSGQENICYYFYYGDALFICVNTETESAKYLNMTSSEFVKAQQDWVESVLQNNTAQYIFLYQHYQAFSTSGAYNSSGYTRWYNICDRYGVDIFFSGNSHVYMRSLPLYEGKVSEDPSKGTVYMVAPSSDGERGEAYTPHTSNTDKIVKSWSDSKAQAASLVKVTKDGISLTLYNYDGTVLDSMEMAAKRAPSETINTDLSGFDKEGFEKAIKIEVNEEDITNPSIVFPIDASEVLKSMKIYNKDTNQVYYNGMVFNNTKEVSLNDINKGTVNIVVEIHYIDSTTKTLNFILDNKYIWGSIKDVEIVTENDDYYLEWKEELNYKVIGSKNVYVNNSLYKKIDKNTSKVILPNDGGDYNVKLVVKDIDGEIIYTSDVKKYHSPMKYTVIFLDSDGKEVSKQVVVEGSSATAPEYNPPEGYEFVKWNEDFTNVQSDLSIHVVIKETKTSEEVSEEPEPEVTPTPSTSTKKSCKNKKNIGIITLLFLNSLSALIILRKKNQ